jgi:prephenate dehydrogenase
VSISPVLVIGTGLVGTSVGHALAQAGQQVHLHDARTAHAQVAAGLGAGTMDPPVPSQVGLVVAAVPPRALPQVIANALTTYPNAAVTDVGSVKAGVLHQLWNTVEDLGRYVGSHPMAGSQLSGPLTARADLFRGRTWVVTPHRRSNPAAVAAVEEMIAFTGADPVRMDVDVHDAAVARVSHLPHLMSVLTAQRLNDTPPEQLRLAGQGLRDVTRIAGSSPALWHEILAANAAALLPELHAVADQLSDLISSIETDQSGNLRPHLDLGLTGIGQIPGKHGGAVVEYRYIVAEIPDTPGALTRLFADVGQVGVNVEDISIEHDPVRQVGYLSLAVQPEQAAKLFTSMTDSGWSPSYAEDDG